MNCLIGSERERANAQTPATRNSPDTVRATDYPAF